MNSKPCGLAVSLLYGCAALAGTPPADHRNFVSCPIVRDTTTVPCWLAEHEGELYFLTLQTDVSVPKVDGDEDFDTRKVIVSVKP